MQLGPPPNLVPLTPTPGVYQHPEYGQVDFSPDTLQRLLENFNLYGRPLPFRAQHGSRQKLGWIVRLLRDPASRLVGEVQWTPSGAQAWQDGQVRMVSPEVHRDHHGVEGKRGPVLLGLAAADVPYFTPKYMQALFEEENMDEVFEGEVEIDAAPVVQLYQEDENWVVSRGALELPIAEGDPTWDGGAAQARVWELDQDRWADAHLAVNRASPELHGSYKFPVADAVDGVLRIIPAAVRAARSRASQADLPADVAEGVFELAGQLMEKITPSEDEETMSETEAVVSVDAALDEVVEAAEEAPAESAQSANSPPQSFEELKAALEQQFAEERQRLEAQRDEALQQAARMTREKSLQSFGDDLAAHTFDGDRRFAPAALDAFRAFADAHPEIDLDELSALARAAVTLPAGERSLAAVEAPEEADPEKRFARVYGELVSSGVPERTAWTQAVQRLSEAEKAQLFPDARAARQQALGE